MLKVSIANIFDKQHSGTNLYNGEFVKFKASDRLASHG